MKKICLCMIVRDESRVIKRCLDSVKDFIDYWIISDTGSIDDTKEIIQETMRGIPGELVDTPWKSGAFNRSEILRLSKDKSEYSLILDADEFMVFDEGFDKAKFKESSLDLDAYDVAYEHANLHYLRRAITKNSLEWSYKGATHEYAVSVKAVKSHGTPKGFFLSTFGDGFRSQSKDKYQGDAKVLEEALASETDEFSIRRYTFYLAQAYRDSNQNQLAYEFYLKRANLGGWNEEISMSFLSAAKLAINLNKTQEEILSLLSKSFCVTPWRAEAIHDAALYLRNNGQIGLSYLIAKSGLDIPMPINSLFVCRSVYEYSLLDEFAVAAYHAGKFGECRDACIKLLNSKKLPANSIERVTKNLRFCDGKT